MGRTPSRVTCGTRSPSRYGRVRFSPDRHTYALAVRIVRGAPGIVIIPVIVLAVDRWLLR